MNDEVKLFERKALLDYFVVWVRNMRSIDIGERPYRNADSDDRRSAYVTTFALTPTVYVELSTEKRLLPHVDCYSSFVVQSKQKLYHTSTLSER